MSNLFKKLTKLFSFIINSKFLFGMPVKNDVLIFDKVHSEKIKSILSFGNNPFILCQRGEEFYLPILIKTLFQCKLTMKNYCEKVINIVDPKIIISCLDNNNLYFSINKNKRSKKVVLQNAWRNEMYDDLLKDFKTRKKKNFSMDYIFTFNKKIGKKFNKVVKAKIIPIGSFKSNIISVNKKKSKNIVFISNWGDKPQDKALVGNFLYKDFFKRQKQIFENVIFFARKKKTNVHVLCRTSNPKEISLEKNFFLDNKHQLKNIKFCTEERKKFEIIDKAEMIITLNSTLGYEAFSRKKKIIFFNLYDNKKKYETGNFAWPYKLKRNGFFWTDDLTKKNCYRYFEKIYNLKASVWEKIYKKIYKNIMIRDYNNSILKKFLKKF